MKRILISLFLGLLTSTACARPTTALTYALIRILQNGKCVEKAVCPVMAEVSEESKPLVTWSDEAFDTDLEGDWDHKIACDLEIPSEKNRNAYLIMSSIYTVIDYWGSHTISNETVLACNLSEETMHRQTFEGKNKIVVEMAFTRHPESVK